MNINHINRKAWQEAVRELEAARRLFNYANNPYYIDIAMNLEDTAKAKLESLKTLCHYEQITTPALTCEERKQKDNYFKKLIEWIMEPINNMPPIKPLEKLTWVDLRKAAGFKVKPVANYDDIERSEKHD